MYYNIYYVIGFYNRWNNSFNRRHPSIWLFLRKLKDEQTVTEIAVAAARNGYAPPVRKRKWRNFEARLQALKDQYNTGARNVDQYWEAVAATIRLFR
jgi:hypothetical protein